MPQYCHFEGANLRRLPPGRRLSRPSLMCGLSRRRLLASGPVCTDLPARLFCPCFLSDAQCVRECLWDCNTSVHFSPFALHLCTWLRVTVRERMTSHEAPLNLRCGVTAVPCGAPYEKPHDVPVVDGASRVTKPTCGRFPSVAAWEGASERLLPCTERM